MMPDPKSHRPVVNARTATTRIPALSPMRKLAIALSLYIRIVGATGSGKMVRSEVGKVFGRLFSRHGSRAIGRGDQWPRVAAHRVAGNYEFSGYASQRGTQELDDPSTRQLKKAKAYTSFVWASARDIGTERRGCRAARALRANGPFSSAPDRAVYRQTAPP